MKIALIVGVSYGDKLGDICINDARKIHDMLSFNEDDTKNFDCKLLTFTPDSENKREQLLANLAKLFDKKAADSALFYFSGHGTVTKLGGYLVAEKGSKYGGVDMNDITELATKSQIREICILVDCCYAGNVGGFEFGESNTALLRQGISVLTSSGESETSAATKTGGSVFTSLVCDALKGGAADIFGDVNVAGVYGYIDRALGAWDQRPLFKANVERLSPLRRCSPLIDLAIVRKLVTYFPAPDAQHQMDPSYEPTEGHGNKENEEIMKHFQMLRDVGFLIPDGVDHLYYAATESKACKLTPVGQYYWQLVKKGKL